MDIGFDQIQVEVQPVEQPTLEGCLLAGLVIVAAELLMGVLGMAVFMAILYGISLLL